MNFNNLSDVIFRRRCENLKKNLHTSLDCMGRVKATHLLLSRVCGNLEKVHSLCEEGSILSYSHNGPSKNDCNTSIFYAIGIYKHTFYSFVRQGHCLSDSIDSK